MTIDYALSNSFGFGGTNARAAVQAIRGMTHDVRRETRAELAASDCLCVLCGLRAL